MIVHDHRIAENTASDSQRLYGNTFQRDRAIVSDYMETIFSDRAIVSDPTLQWFYRYGDRERSYGN